MDVIPSTVSAASVRLEHGYDQSSVAEARVPARSPRPSWPAGPPKSAMTVVLLVSPELAEALLVGAAAVTPTVTPLRLRIHNGKTSSCHHDSPRWTTMKTLNMLKSVLRLW